MCSDKEVAIGEALTAGGAVKRVFYGELTGYF